jgi:hypothetical protein
MILTKKLLSRQKCNSYLTSLPIILPYILPRTGEVGFWLNSAQACTATPSTHAPLSLAQDSLLNLKSNWPQLAHGPISLLAILPILGPPRHLSSPLFGGYDLHGSHSY